MDAISMARPGTCGRMPATLRAERLRTWAGFINGELAARGLRPGQLARYANVDPATVSVWRHARSLPNPDAVASVAACLRLPVELVAEQAGMLPGSRQLRLGRADTDPEWRRLLAEIDRLPADQFRDVKHALRLALSTWSRRHAG